MFFKQKGVRILELNQTQKLTAVSSFANKVDNILQTVYAALEEKGYNPVNQIVGYILSGDPTYITSHNNARVIIGKVERDELLEVLVKNYMDNR